MYLELAAAGFDVKTVAVELQEFYLSCAGTSQSCRGNGKPGEAMGEV